MTGPSSTHCNHGFPDPYPQPLNQPGNCRNCGITYQQAKSEAQP